MALARAQSDLVFRGAPPFLQGLSAKGLPRGNTARLIEIDLNSEYVTGGWVIDTRVTGLSRVYAAWLWGRSTDPIGNAVPDHGYQLRFIPQNDGTGLLKAYKNNAEVSNGAQSGAGDTQWVLFVGVG